MQEYAASLFATGGRGVSGVISQQNFKRTVPLLSKGLNWGRCKIQRWVARLRISSETYGPETPLQIPQARNTMYRYQWPELLIIPLNKALSSYRSAWRQSAYITVNIARSLIFDLPSHPPPLRLREIPELQTRDNSDNRNSESMARSYSKKKYKINKFLL